MYVCIVLSNHVCSYAESLWEHQEWTLQNPRGWWEWPHTHFFQSGPWRLATQTGSVYTGHKYALSHTPTPTPTEAHTHTISVGGFNMWAVHVNDPPTLPTICVCVCVTIPLFFHHLINNTCSLLPVGHVQRYELFTCQQSCKHTLQTPTHWSHRPSSCTRQHIHNHIYTETIPSHRCAHIHTDNWWTDVSLSMAMTTCLLSGPTVPPKGLKAALIRNAQL